MAKRKTYTREFKIEAVNLITKEGYSVPEVSRSGYYAWRDCPESASA